MPSVIITPPVIEESQLLFDEKETIVILSFFWPEKTDSFNEMAVTTGARQLAQTIFITAIDASYAMGWVDALFRSVSKPTSLAGLGKKLAKNYIKHWWKHAKVKDLENVKIYESVRKTVALKFLADMSMFLNGISAQLRMTPFVVTSVGATTAWV